MALTDGASLMTTARLAAMTPAPQSSDLQPGAAAPPTAHAGGWRERLLGEAAELTRSGGWQSITMARLADRVGVSRQTVYNEIGSKSQLAEAMVMRELELFLRQVDAAFAEYPDDLVEAIRAAAEAVLEMARTNPLLHAVLSASHGAQSDLLPLLTTQAEPLIEVARAMIMGQLASYSVTIEAERVEPLVDAVVRIVLSHVTVPGDATPAQTADEIAWLVTRVLGL